MKSLKPKKVLLRAHELEEMPVVFTETVVCRDDLLFEIEADAIQAAG